MSKGQAIRNIQNNFIGPIDVTLREGGQFAGQLIEDESGGHFEDFAFSTPQAKQILTNLYHLGIEYAEVPNGLIDGANPMIRDLIALPERPKLLCHIRNNLKDVQAAINLGVDGINILTFVDPERLVTAGYQSFCDYLKVLQQVIQNAKEHRLQTRVSVEHAWNGYFDQALNVFELANDLGADRIGLADTVGIANRFDVADIITQTRQRVPKVDIEVHFHNDGSLAVANAIEALMYGANYVDTTFAGIGERSGITPLSGLLTQLYLLEPMIVKDLHLKFLTPAELDVMQMVSLPVPHNLITASNGFAHKAGIHTKAILTHSLHEEKYQPFSAGIVGNQTRIITNSRISGRTSADNIRAVVPGAQVQ